MPQKNIQVVFQALGLDKVTAGISKAKDTANQFAGTYTAKIAADDKDFKATVASDLKQAQELGKKEIRVKATVDDGDAEAKMKILQAEADKLGLKKIKIDMSTNGEGKTLLTLGATNT